MLYVLDTANIDKIRECIEYYPVDGVTTNPTIISKENSNFPALIKGIREVIGPDRMLHIQTTEQTADKIIKEAVQLKEFVGGNFYIKIPITADGLKATSALKKMGIKVTETAIFTQQQALIAARAGADFVAPYVNRLDNIVSDGVNVVVEIVSLLKSNCCDTKVLAASFKTVEQVHKISLAGTHAVTMTPEFFKTLIYHPMTLYAIDDFMADWQNAYGEKKISDLLK